MAAGSQKYSERLENKIYFSAGDVAKNTLYWLKDWDKHSVLLVNPLNQFVFS